MFEAEEHAHGEEEPVQGHVFIHRQGGFQFEASQRGF
jgi:hypothetical protein